MVFFSWSRYMKWYKKQLNSLQISLGDAGQPLPQKGSINSLGGKKIPPHIKNFRNPVAESKRSRSKTDK